MASQEQRLINELPEFFGDQIVFCDKILIHRKQHYLVLARNLKFYEFYQKQLVNSIDLSETCFRKISQSVRDYKGSKLKWFENISSRSVDYFGGTENPIDTMDTSEVQISIPLREKPTANTNIFIGKYVYRNFDANKIYLLVRCWDKLVVIALSNYALVTEFEDVKSFRIVHGKEKFEALLEIQFENSNTQYEDFQKHDNFASLPPTKCNIVSDRYSLKQLMERVRCAKSELQLYKSITQKEFDTLRDQETFGCNYIRSDQLEEKPMISRCGDIWLRFVPNDNIVFGVPLTNNCSTNSLTILKNLRPILKINDTTVENIVYKYRFYQLRLNFDDFETMETFFQTEDEELQSPTAPWVSCELPQLLPTSFAVLLIAIKTSNLLLLEECPLFLRFEIEKEQPNLRGHSIKNSIYEQHIFLKTLNISHILLNRENYQLSFNSPTFHQDFLATAMMNKEVILAIQFISPHSAHLFEQLITNKFNFTTVQRKLTPQKYEMDNDIPSGPNEVTNDKYFASSIHFNKDPNSLWFGSMVLKLISAAENEDVQMWKLYSYNKEKAFICLKLLFTELQLLNCKIKNIEFFGKKQDSAEESYLYIKEMLFGELEYLKELNECADDIGRRKIFFKLLKSQINADMLITSIK